MLIPDAFGEPGRFLSLLNARDVSVDAINAAIMRGTSPYRHRPDQPQMLSLYQTYGYDKFVTANISQAKAYYTAESFSAPNGGGFVSRERWLRSKIADGVHLAVPADWNEYFGLLLAENRVLPINNLTDDFPLGLASATGKVLIEGGANHLPASLLGGYLVNLYPGSGPRTLEQLKQVYGTTADLKYTPISPRLSWAELEASLDSNRNYAAFGGDCYVNVNFRHLYRRFDGGNDITFNDEQKGVPVSCAVSFVSESVSNTLLRGTEIGPGGNNPEKTFLPMLDGNTTTFNDYRLKRYQQPEAKSYNRGYSVTGGDKQYLALPENLPFLADHWFSRVFFLGPQIPSAFRNPWRQWTGLNYRDYTTEHGELVGLRVANGRLYGVFERGIEVIPINERIQTGSDAAGAIFVESGGVLSPKTGRISGLYGSRHLSSLIASDNTLYGVDGRAKTIWRIGQSGLELISEVAVQAHLAKYAGVYGSLPIRQGEKDIVGGFDPLTKEILFSFLSGTPAGNDTFTLAYSEHEATPGFVGYRSGHAYRYLSLPESIHGFSLTEGQKLWNYAGNPLRNSLHGIAEPTVIEMIVNVDSDAEKIWENLSILSNHCIPYKIEYFVPGAKGEHLTVERTNLNIHLANCNYRGEKLDVTIPKVQTVTNEGESGYWVSEVENSQSLQGIKARMRGRAIRIRITYQTDKLLRLKGVNTHYRYSVV